MHIQSHKVLADVQLLTSLPVHVMLRELLQKAENHYSVIMENALNSVYHLGIRDFMTSSITGLAVMLLFV